MGDMKFQVKLVRQTKNPRAWISNSGAIIFLISIFVMLVDDGKYSGWTAFLGFSLMITGAILTRKNPLMIELSDIDLIVTSHGVSIGDQFYPMDQVKYLDFLVNGHYGMRAGTMTKWTLRRTRINGAENKLLFEVDGKKHAYPFFLEDHVSMRELEFLFREFYQNRLFFRERNRGGRTFLFRQVASRQDLERAKQGEGYV